MDTKKLELLLKAMEIGSLKKTAEMYNYTQSGIVYTINSLEKELGLQFIQRSSKGVVPTPEGRILKPYLEELLAASRSFEERVELLLDDKTPTLEIGVWPSMARIWLPGLLRCFREKYPNVRVNIRIATKDLTALLEEGAIDCAIGPYNIAGENNYIHLKDEQLYVAVPADFPLPGGVPVALEDLSSYPVFLTAHFPTGSGSQAFQDWYFSLAASQKVYIKSADGLTLLAMVEQGYGVAFLSQIYEAECPETVRMLPLEQSLITETVLAFSPVRRVTNVLDDFVQTVQEYIAERQTGKLSLPEEKA